MADMCRNIIVITGNRSIVDEIDNKFRGTNNEYSLANIRPMPVFIKTEENTKLEKEFKEKYKDMSYLDIYNLPDDTFPTQKIWKEYKWGTAWDLDNDTFVKSVISKTDKTKSIIYRFETAWNHVLPIAWFLEDMYYPQVNIEYEYCLEGADRFGYYRNFKAVEYTIKELIRHPNILDKFKYIHELLADNMVLYRQCHEDD